MKSVGTGFNLSTSNRFSLLFKLFKAFGASYSLSISNWPTSDFKLGKSVILVKFYVSAPVAFFKSDFVKPGFTLFLLRVYGSRE